MSDIEKDKYGVMPLSNFDLIREVSKVKDRVNIIDTTDTSHINNVEDIFKNRGHAILFIPPKKNDSEVGHWVVLTRQDTGGRTRKGTCTYFDSYGDRLQDNNIRKILENKYKTIDENKKQYQQYNTNLCGYWTLLCIVLNKVIKEFSLKDLDKFLQTKPTNMSYDKFVGSVLDAT